MGLVKMIKNKRGDAEGFKKMTSEVITLLFSALIIIVLVYLGIKIFNFYSDKSESQRGESELNEILSNLRQTAEENIEKKYKVLYAPEWHLLSFEFADLCEGPFCLCICKDLDCKDENARACVATERFVLIRKEGKELREIQIQEAPSEIKFRFENQEVYPFNAGNNARKGWFGYETTTPILLKFDKEWLWSPDLQNWMKTSTIVVQGGLWDSEKVSDDNEIFIKNRMLLIKDSKEKGEDLLNKLDGKISKGVYIIEQ